MMLTKMMRGVACAVVAGWLGACATTGPVAGGPGKAGAQSAGDLVLALQRFESPLRWTNGMRTVVGGTPYRVSFSRMNPPLVAPTLFDDFILASRVKSEGVDVRVATPGAGTPLVARAAGERGEVRERFHPKHGFYGPVTAVLTTNGPADATGAVPVTLHFVFTRNTDTVRLGGREVKLATDLTAPLEKCLNHSLLKDLATAGFFNPRRGIGELGLYLVGPYDPNKVPIIFTHGLNSDPHIWLNAMNTVLADPDLRSRYMLWYYTYPTGLPVPGSAQRMRWELDKVRKHYDPDQNDPGFNRMILVGHSMGGIVSRLQVIDSGNDFWSEYFTRPPERLILSEKSRDLLTGALFFKRQPFVSRAIFVATPHRGSGIADWGLARWLTSFVKLPFRTLEIATELATLNTDSINPELFKFNGLGLASVDMLSPSHPYFRSIAKRPILVPYHSIIGDRGKGNSPNSSDGVVPYWSSHLDGAQSEKIVPWGHGCVEKTETCQEIARILREAAGLPPRRAE